GGSHFYRAVARLGVQAAEGLEHAHQYGVVHRDVKPGNLLVDTHGHLWITDFGLAQFQADAGLTQTGDLLGTLRYLTPQHPAPPRPGPRAAALPPGATLPGVPPPAAALRGARPPPPAAEAPPGGAAAAAPPPRRHPRRAGDDHPQGDGQGARRALRHGAGVRR